MHMRVEHLAGIVVALAALSGEVFAANRVTADARTAAKLKASQHTQKQLGEVAEALSTLPAQLVPRFGSHEIFERFEIGVGADEHR